MGHIVAFERNNKPSSICLPLRNEHVIGLGHGIVIAHGIVSAHGIVIATAIALVIATVIMICTILFASFVLGGRRGNQSPVCFVRPFEC